MTFEEFAAKLKEDKEIEKRFNALMDDIQPANENNSYSYEQLAEVAKQMGLDVEVPDIAELSDDEMDEVTGGSDPWVSKNGCSRREVCAWRAGEWYCCVVGNN